MSSSPSQKFGTAMPTDVPTVNVRSSHVPRRFAASMPIGIPMATLSRNDVATSESVIGSRSRIASLTS